MEAISKLLISIIDILPKKFYAHLSPELEIHLQDSFSLESYGLYYRMMLIKWSDDLLSKIDTTKVKRLSVSDLPMIKTLYDESYPGNWFDKRMLETNQYFGIFEGNRLVSIAGIHVFSPKYKVAALGNITTHPDYRNKGFGKMVSARLCKSLLDEGIENIGLNVKADNLAAISSYEKIGFERVTDYNEFVVERL